MKILKFLYSLTFALVFATIGAMIIGPLIDVKPIFPFAVFMAVNFIPGPQGALFELIGTAPGGIGTPFLFNLPYLPEILHWNDAAAPIATLRVTTDKEAVLHDMNAAAIAAMRGYRKTGPMAANDQDVQLATGELVRNVSIAGTTSAAGAINFYAHSDNRPTEKSPVFPLKTSMETTIALTATTFENFLALFIPTMATLTDYADIEFSDGLVKRFEIEDLIAMSTNYQDTAAIIISNHTSYIHKIVLRCAANTPTYVLRLYIKGQ